MKRGKRRLAPMHDEVLLEFHPPHGNVMRVIAIDPKTGTEVTMVADTRHSKSMIKRIAARKLAYVLNKKAAQKTQHR